MKSYKVDILAFGAHPDDVECAISGAIVKHIAMGKKVAIVDLTVGEMGTYGSAEMRIQEATKAAEILGISHREQLGLKDGAIKNDESSRIKIIESIRKYQPEIILSNAIHDRHPDHANTAKLVNDANFLSGLKNIKTSLHGKPQNKWRSEFVYNYVQDFFIEPDFVIDITDVMARKIESILAYKSQFKDPNNTNPNSISGLIDQIKSTNSIYGRQINTKFAEGFTVNKYIGVRDFFQLD
ncbi:bacillithiol biosynthesis deacetylase BshB1 [Flavobacteriales bacterium 33_180_T64]|mgnify:CR=1 FL=1|nr:bacillithiol biosynthesis deacetylase BshB1 [Flavobacteriales bacterium 33_180_T64]